MDYFKRNAKSKTFWTGASAILGFTGALYMGEINAAAAVNGIVMSLLGMFVRDGVSPK